MLSAGYSVPLGNDASEACVTLIFRGFKLLAKYIAQNLGGKRESSFVKRIELSQSQGSRMTAHLGWSRHCDDDFARRFAGQHLIQGIDGLLQRIDRRDVRLDGTR